VWGTRKDKLMKEVLSPSNNERPQCSLPENCSIFDEAAAEIAASITLTIPTRS
jgi:hypothetical protein